jgi:hypothetical protein
MMRKFGLMLCVLAPLTATLSAAGGAITTEERNYLLEQLEASRKGFVASIQGLTPAQWTFKPAPAVWSVQECAEHIILAENFIRDNSMALLKTPEVPRPAASNADVDKKIVAGVADRSKKVSAPEPLVPGTHYATPDDAIREFTARRDKTVAYVKSTDDQLRVHVGPGPAGPMDAYQGLLLLASHSVRHTSQIKEVEGNAEYPKK